MSKRTKSTGPLCKVCGVTNNVGFAMFPKTKGYQFGDICEVCDEQPQAPSGWKSIEGGSEGTSDESPCGWIPKNVHEAYQVALSTIGVDTLHPISAQAYLEALECMPPIYGQHRFWVSESYCDDVSGKPISLEVRTIQSQHYCRMSIIGHHADKDFPGSYGPAKICSPLSAALSRD